MNWSSAARVPVIGLTAAAASMITATSVAAEWTVTPSGSAFTLGQQNPNFVPDGKDDSLAFGGNAALQVRRRTERLSLDLQSTYGAYRYRRDDNLDRDDASLGLSGLWQGERMAWSGTARATRDTTLTSELGTTGLTQGNSRHESYDLSFGPSWQPSERVIAGVSAGYDASRYPGAAAAGLVDYAQGSASGYVSYTYSERLTLTFAGAAGRLSNKGAADDTTNTNVTVAARYALGEKWSTEASVGPSLVESGGQRERGYVYGLSASRAFERATFSINASRSQEPAGRGLLTELQRVGAAFSTQLTERLSVSTTAAVTHRRNALQAFGLNLDDVKYTRGELALGWRANANWQLGFVVGGTNQRRATFFGFGEPERARGYDARLALSWNGNPYVH